MRPCTGWGLALIVSLVIWTAQAPAQEDDQVDTRSGGRPRGFRWSPGFARMMGIDQSKSAPKKKSPTTKAKDSKQSAVNERAPRPQNQSNERAAEETKLLRRWQVCDKLMEIAIKQNDTDLLHKAEVLEERARTAYAQKTAFLKGPSEFESDEQSLAGYLSRSDRPADKTAPRILHDAPHRDRSARAETGEEKP